MTRAPRLAGIGASALAAGVLLAPAVVLAPAGAAPSPYGSCADVRAAIPGAPDGEYDITSYGRTLSVWCADMATTPVEYLTLQRGGPGVNVATSNNNWAPYVQTQFTRIGLNLPASAADPFTFRPADFRYSANTAGVGQVQYGTGGAAASRRARSTSTCAAPRSPSVPTRWRAPAGWATETSSAPTASRCWRRRTPVATAAACA